MAPSRTPVAGQQRSFRATLQPRPWTEREAPKACSQGPLWGKGRPMRTLRLRLLLCAALFASCAPGTSADGGRPTPDASAPDAAAPALTLEALAAAWDPLGCAAFACVRQTEVTAEVCVRARSERSAPFSSLTRALASTDAGRARFDPDAGARCLDFLATLDASTPCFGPQAPPLLPLLEPAFAQACGAVVVGTVDAGGACDEAWECGAGADCRFGRNPDCRGVCVALRPVGAPCADAPNDCAPDTFCNSEFCTALQLKADGQACVLGSECASGRCPGRVLPSPSLGGVCETKSPLNWECSTDGECEQGLFCRPLPPSTGYLGYCKLGAQPGQPCDLFERCLGNQLCTGYFRAPTGGRADAGTCQAQPGAVGAPCAPQPPGTEGDTGCFKNLRCEPGTATCAPAPALGAACAAQEPRCGLDAWCDGARCQPKKPYFAPADAGVECLQEFDPFARQCTSFAEQARCAKP